MVNAQDWLNKYYPHTERKNITHINIYPDLEGYLDLKGFINLKEIYCSGKKISGLNVKECNKLESLCCSDNNLTSIEFLNHLPDKTKLTVLDVRNNNFFQQDLKFL